MRPRPAPKTDVATAIDDFEWPPQTDGLSIHEIAPDPWRPPTTPARDTVIEADAPPAANDTAAIDRPSTTVRLTIWRRNR